MKLILCVYAVLGNITQNSGEITLLWWFHDELAGYHGVFRLVIVPNPPV